MPRAAPGKVERVAELTSGNNAEQEAINGRDPIVRRVLAALVADARRDSERLAALAGLSAEQVRELIAALEQQRVIRGYKTVVDWERLGAERVVALCLCVRIGARGDAIPRLGARSSPHAQQP